MTASARTRYLGILGFPVAHSYSPAMQEAAFFARGLDLRYGAFSVSPALLGDAIRGAGTLGFVGLNVTVPHKEAAFLLCRPDALASRIGAVNTLVFGEPAEPPRGLNTDAWGFRQLAREAGIDLSGAAAVVLGAGGAARAVVSVLLDEGARVTVVSRRDRPLALAGAPAISHLRWDESGDGGALRDLLGTCALLVDATPRGLDPASRFDLTPLCADAAVVDLAVRPTTPLVAAARARGLHAVTGEAMLVHQGAAAFEAWTGTPAPIEVMRAALLGALARTERG